VDVEPGLLVVEASSTERSASRFIDRTDIIVKEANALGNSLLESRYHREPQRGELKSALREYTADRVKLLSRERTRSD